MATAPALDHRQPGHLPEDEGGEKKRTPRVCAAFRICLFPHEKWMRKRFAEERLPQGIFRDEYNFVVAQDLWQIYLQYWNKKAAEINLKHQQITLRKALDLQLTTTTTSDSHCYNAVWYGRLTNAQRGEFWITQAGAHLAPHAPVRVMSRDSDGRISDEMDEQIQRDTFRTFTDIAGRNPTLLIRLNRLLRAYVHYRPARGYTQGMNYVAIAVLLFVVDDSDAFWTFVYLCDDVLTNYFMKDLVGMHADGDVLLYYIKRRFPEVAEHWHRLGFDPVLFVSRWFSTLFLYVMAPCAAFRLIDHVMFRGPAVLFEVMLGTVKKFYNESVRQCTDLTDMFNMLNAQVRTVFDLTDLLSTSEDTRIEQNSFIFRRKMALRRRLSRLPSRPEIGQRSELWQITDETDDDVPEEPTDTVCVDSEGELRVVPIPSPTLHATTASSGSDEDDEGEGVTE